MLASSVGLMTDYPACGRVLTKLAGDVGDEKALAIFSAMVANATDAVCSLEAKQFLRAAFIGPGGLMENFSNQFDRFDAYFRQDGEDAGEKMLTALSTLIEQEGAMRALLVASDVPDMSTEIIVDANKMLDKHDLVLGPCTDGGYCLIGMRKVVPDLFFNVDWGSGEVLHTTMQTAGKKKLNVGLLPELRRLHTLDDLDHFKHLFA